MHQICPMLTVPYSRAISKTDYEFPAQRKRYQGKVRDMYYVGDLIVMVVTDRISAFDVILPEAIPFKGQVLNQIAGIFMDMTSDIVPNWMISQPDPNVTIGHYVEPFRVEMVIRGYLAGHAWRVYREGGRKICGVSLPDGLQMNDKLPSPIITPAYKAESGHDEDISRDEIIQSGLVGPSDYLKLEELTHALYERGQEVARERGLLLVDTKYEFGKLNGQVMLIDEIHTPDSSRYFYLDTYKELQSKGEPQKHLSKEFVREWLMSEGFSGQEGQQVPEMTEEIVKMISLRYIELFEQLTGQPFDRVPLDQPLAERIQDNVSDYLKTLA